MRLEKLTFPIAYVNSVKNNLTTDINGKLSKPSLAGESGQVLVSDGNGGQVWGEIAAGEVVIDPSLSVPGAAADAAATGELKSAIDGIAEVTVTHEQSNNRWNPDATTDGKYYMSDGSIASNSSYVLSDYIDTEGKDYVQGCAQYGSGSFTFNCDGAVFFDSSKTFISNSKVTSISSAVSVPSGAKYVRAWFQKVDNQIFVGVSDSTSLPTYDEYFNGYKNILEDRVETLEEETEDIDSRTDNLEEGLEDLHDDIFTEVKPNVLRYADKASTSTGTGLTYSITDGILSIAGTTTAGTSIEIPLTEDIPAGNYFFNNFIQYESISTITGSFSLKTAGNQYITLAADTSKNVSVAVTSDKPVSIWIYIGNNKTINNTYHMCLTSESLGNNPVYPEDSTVLSSTIKGMLNDEYFPNNVAQNRVVCWGDSLTDGAGATGTPANGYPERLQTLLTSGGNSLTVANGGIGGEDTYAIGFRQGGIELQIDPFTIPASGASSAVTIHKWNGREVEILKRGGTNVTVNYTKLRLNPVKISGVSGDLLRNNDGDIVFTRTASGSAVTVSRPVPIFVDALENYNLPTDITIIWAGTNNIHDTSDVNVIIDSINAMISMLKNSKYIVIGLTCKYVFSDIANMNFAMANAFDKHFLNIRDYLLEYGIDDAEAEGMERTAEKEAQDETDISNGEIPSSLRSDYVHLNDWSYQIVAEQLYKKGQWLGYWQ